MNSPNWNKVKEFYKKSFGIDGWVVEVLANLDILVLCASGSSNKSISNYTELPESEVKEVILQTFSFTGWEVDLPFNPYKIYNEMSQMPTPFGVDEFIKELRLIYTPYGNGNSIDFYFVFKVCETMDTIERRIYDEWI
jgi:hypothetical protein